jgi:hypothetical protein
MPVDRPMVDSFRDAGSSAPRRAVLLFAHGQAPVDSGSGQP